MAGRGEAARARPDDFHHGERRIVVAEHAERDRLEEDETGHAIGMPRRVAQRDEPAERVADEMDARMRRHETIDALGDVSGFVVDRMGAAVCRRRLVAIFGSLKIVEVPVESLRSLDPGLRVSMKNRPVLDARDSLGRFDDAERTVRWTITTGNVDRDRDVVTPGGVKTDTYLKNPVVLFAHDYQSLPVAKTTNLTQNGNKWSADAQFAPHDLYPFADTVYRMVKAGFLNASSIGFRPMEWNFNEERKGVDFMSIGISSGLPFIREGAVADLVVFMHKGKVWETGPTAELFANPRAEYTRELLAAAFA